MNTISINRIAFTVCNLGYLNKALVLANSLNQTNQLRTNIFIFDNEIDLPTFEDHIIITWIKDVAGDDFLKHAFKYNVIELTTAYKPFIANKLIEVYDQVLFFDPDIMFFGDLETVYKKLNSNCFLLTPHLCNVQSEPSENIHLQRFGFYNLGFFAFDNSNYSKSILDWWWKQCIDYCYDESSRGMFTDQKWMSLAPFYFPKISVIKDYGLNVAWWNLKEREINFEDDQFFINGSPLIFFHFSSFVSQNKLTKRPFNPGTNKLAILLQLALQYENNLNKIHLNINKIYSFDYFNDGDYINQLLRTAYSANIDLFSKIENPFSKPREIKIYIKKNNLKSRGVANYSHIGYQDKNKHIKIIWFYAFILRIVVFVIGPNRYIAFNRLMNYSNSLMNFKEFWRK